MASRSASEFFLDDDAAASASRFRFFSAAGIVAIAAFSAAFSAFADFSRAVKKRVAPQNVPFCEPFHLPFWRMNE